MMNNANYDVLPLNDRYFLKRFLNRDNNLSPDAHLGEEMWVKIMTYLHTRDVALHVEDPNE